MAWGSTSRGLDDLCARLRRNDPGLASLTILKHRRFDEIEVRRLCESLASNTTLTELYASNHAVPPSSAALLAALLSRSETLTTLCVGDASFGDAGVEALSAGLACSKSLQALDLENKGITAAGAEALSRVLAESKSLQRLCLARNPLADRGIPALSGQGGWPYLLHLDLRECGLTAACTAHLAQALRCASVCRLTSLDLSGNNLGGPAPPGHDPVLGGGPDQPAAALDLDSRIGCRPPGLSAKNGASDLRSGSGVPGPSTEDGPTGDGPPCTSSTNDLPPESSSPGILSTNSSRGLTSMRSSPGVVSDGGPAPPHVLPLSDPDPLWSTAPAPSGPDLGHLLRSAPSLEQLRLRGCGLTDPGVVALAGALPGHGRLLVLDLGDNECGTVGGLVQEAGRVGPRG